MKYDQSLKIAVLPGDGIGVDVTQAAIPIFEAMNIPVQLTFGDIGWSYWQREGTPIPKRTWKLIADSDATLLGAITSKPEREAQSELNKAFQNKNINYLSPIIQLRQKLDLFANVRPCFAINNPKNKFNFCIIRENTEGLYSGFDYFPTPDPILSLLANNPHWQNIPGDDISSSLRLQSKTGLLRIFKYAFKYAVDHGMKRVTFADKPNVLRQSSDFARSIFEMVSAQYPQLQADILNVDAVALWLIRRPEEFGVIVAENMFADILSDVGAGIMGGLGLAPSANVGVNGCYFEPVHGSAPRIKANSANPSAMFLTISMLLEYLGYRPQSQIIIRAVEEVIKKQRFITYDLGGRATTKDMAKAIIDSCLGANTHSVLLKNELTMNPLQELKTFNSSEISDALDACGVEGALLSLKPLSLGLKLVGPAYTVQFSPYKQKPAEFTPAANYIDTIPSDSVIVIDNHGSKECTAWGGILTQVAQHKKIAGTIVHGAVRDAQFIREVQYPVYCTGVYMRSGKNRIHKVSEQKPLIINSVTINPGDIIFADDNGVLVIPIHLIDDIIKKARNIQRTEQLILGAVAAGSTLEQARIDYRYDQPWLGASDEP